jgi:sulfonate transport system substrate-binding protein
MTGPTRRAVLRGLGAAAGLSGPFAAGRARAAETLRLDYAYYNPLSLVLKDKGWVEEALGPDVGVQWVLSAGSNKALEYLRGRSIDLGSTAGSAALLGRANGTPARIVYVYSRPEWSALVTRQDSGINAVADLKGKRVAATPGTDPGILLLRALAQAGLTRSDITLVPLQHQDGRLALDRGDVDAWAGLDPFMAQAELQNHDRLFFRDRSLNTPGTLLVRDDVIAERGPTVAKVIAAYERARLWALVNPDALAGIVGTATKQPPDVVHQVLSRTDLGNPTLDAAPRGAIGAAAPILKASGSLSGGADIDKAEAELFDGRFSDQLAAR